MNAEQPDFEGEGPDHYFDPSCDQTVGSTPLEKLCIAIIRAHSQRDNADCRSPHLRLRDAVRALQGHHPERGDHKRDDHQLLLRMADHLVAQVEAQLMRESINDAVAQIRRRQELRIALGKDSVARRNFARRVLRETGEPVNEANLTRLARKFEVEWKIHIQTLALASSVPHAWEHRLMKQIAPLLVEMGIPVELPSEPGWFWSLSSDK